LVKVIDLAAVVVPTSCDPKVTVVALNDAAGVVAAGGGVVVSPSTHAGAPACAGNISPQGSELQWDLRLNDVTRVSAGDLAAGH
jgi:hypothetical protein